ncbi:jg24719 [Pararge aegeria aegeria]|uniref:Jg24719 protein n=1 Tax=Pararge aegeria aegeria TaxID=348720 RepID=A0A8S4QIV6_9NEOP|nr:jg24719 [Pararge aegeria aegeria]
MFTGSLSEGIYRRAGSSVVLSELLARFRRDSWSVQLTPGQHSEHDVAGVLKRFFRDLPEPLVPQENHNTLVDVLAQTKMAFGARSRQSTEEILLRSARSATLVDVEGKNHINLPKSS